MFFLTAKGTVTLVKVMLSCFYRRWAFSLRFSDRNHSGHGGLRRGHFIVIIVRQSACLSLGRKFKLVRLSEVEAPLLN